MRNLAPQRARWLRVRMALLCSVLASALGGIVRAAYRVQMQEGAVWREAAERQRQRRLHVEPKRGAIFDRHHATLAGSVEVPSVSADLIDMMRGIEGTPETRRLILQEYAVRLGKALSLDSREVLRKLSHKGRFVWLKRRVTLEEVDAIRRLGDLKQESRPIRGLTIEGEGHRYYPGRELAASVLGFVAPDGQGKEGLELAFNQELRGRVEEIKGLRDRNGRLLFAEGVTEERAFQGHDLHLTLDARIQHLAERELMAASRTHEALWGSLVAIDPRSGEILAMASVPGYNLNDYGTADPEAKRNRSIGQRFEPGSVMKPFVVAGALAAGKIRATDSLYCERGTYRLGSVTIHDTHPAEWLTMTQILAKSSNIAVAKIGLQMKEGGLHAILRKFGFGETTHLPFVGEAAGALRPQGRPWYEIETAIAAYGQGITVTNIQLAMAFGALANHGVLLEPVLVRKMTDARGNILRDFGRQVRREVVPPWVARQVLDMMVAVTEEGGTGVEGAVPGFRVAGKTGTAQKADPRTGRYSADRFLSSFVGVIEPWLVISVVLDEPMVGHYGGALAAPVFRRVAEESLRYLGVPSGETSGRVTQALPFHRAAPLSPLSSPSAVPPSVRRAGGDEVVRMPDVRGRGMRDALRAVQAAGLVPSVEGAGTLVRQSPAPGEPLPVGSTVQLVFEVRE